MENRRGHLNFGGCHSAISGPRKIFAPEERRKSHGSDNQLDVPGVMFFWAQEDVESLTTASSFVCSGRRGVLAGELSVGSVGSVGSVCGSGCGSVAGSAMRSVMPRTSRKARDHLVYDLRVLVSAGILHGNHCQYLSIDTHKGFCSDPIASLIKPYYTIPFNHLQSLQDVNFPGTLCPGT